VTIKTYDFKHLIIKFHVKSYGLHNDKDVVLLKFSTSKSAKNIINISNGARLRWFTGVFNVS